MSAHSHPASSRKHGLLLKRQEPGRRHTGGRWNLRLGLHEQRLQRRALFARFGHQVFLQILEVCGCLAEVRLDFPCFKYF
jgi:hypothetical protein